MTKNVTNRTLHSRVRSYIENHPFISNMLAAGIVNYSALARKMQKEIGGNVETVKVAIARETKNAVKFRGYDENRVIELLKKSRISVQDKTAVVISENKLNIPRLIASEITQNNVYVVDQTKLDLSETRHIKISKDLAALVITSPEKIEHTPGVIAFLTQFFASKGVNIRELISCYTDTIIVLDQKNGARVFALLQEFLK
ncbi:MAG: ACT domain-containing protein [Candidatus Aenigmarchaeota archaeon]|nr:ACT domain-containing protein [Candidatus Aenigmarchaeota archaeon]